MARITYSPGVTRFAGSIGGVTYQRNAFGNTIKQRSNLTKTPTASQAGYQRNMASLISYWPTLSQANKDLWNTFSTNHLHTTPWGESKNLSGYQWFLSVNLNILTIEGSILSTPPTWAAWAPVQSFTLVPSVSFLKITFSPTYNPNAHLKIYLSLPLRQSSLKLRRPLFYVYTIFINYGVDTIDVSTLFENFTNITWTDFYNTANASIICRLLRGDIATGLYSSSVSAIAKINN